MATKTLNRNLIGVLTLGGMVLLAVGGFALLANLPGHDPKIAEEDARKLEAEKKYEMAMNTYVRAYQRDSAKNPEYLVRAAHCAYEDGRVGSVRELVAMARVNNPSLPSASELMTQVELEVAKLFGGAGQWSRVLGEAKKLLEIAPQSALAHRAAGLAYMALTGEDEQYVSKGEEHMKRALELDPADTDVVEALSRRQWGQALEQRARGDRGEAESIEKAADALLRTAIEHCADGEERRKLRRLAAMYDVFMGRTEKGVSALEALAAEEKDTVDSRLVLADLYRGASMLEFPKDLAKAERLLREALAIAPKDGSVYRTMGQLLKQKYFEEKDTEKAKGYMAEEAALYQKGLEEIPKSRDFRKLRDNLNRVYFLRELFNQSIDLARAASGEKERQERIAEAEERLSRVREETDAESIEFRTMNANLLAARGQYIEATREAEAAARVVGSQQNVELQLVLADLYTRQQQWGSALKALENAIGIRPTSSYLRTRAARVYLILNQPAEALRHLKPPEPAALREQMATDPEAIRLRVDAYRQLGQTELADQEQRALGAAPTEPEVVRAARIAAQQGKYAEAESMLKNLLDKNDQDEGALRALLYTYRLSDQREKSRELVKRLLSKYPENRMLQEFDVRLMPESDPERKQKALAYIQGEKEPAVRALMLAEYYLANEQPEEAKQQLDEAERLKPDDPVVVERQFRTALQLKDWSRAERYVAKDASLNLDGTEGKVSQGRLALARGEAERAIELLKAGLQRYPSYSMGWTFLAEAYMNKGRLGDARFALQKALDADPTNGYANRGLADLCLREGDEKAAQKHLEAALRAMPEDDWVNRRLRILKEKDHPETGIAEREKLRRERPEDTDNLVLLARLYADAKVAQYDKAEEAYREALKSSKNDLGLAREIATFFGRPEVNRPGEGEELLSGLLRSEADKSRKALLAVYLGMFYEGQKALATADRHFRMAVSLDPSVQVLTLTAEFHARTNRYKDSLDYYTRVLKLPEVASDVLKSTRSRVIALLLALGDLDAAKKSIDEYMSAYPDDSQGMIYEGAYHRIGGDIQKAKEAFDAHLESDPDNAVALWQRGQLFMLLGRWQSAADDLRKAKAFNPSGFEFEHRISLAQCLVETGQPEAAISELKSVLEEDADAVNVARALIETYVRMRPARYADAEGVIYTYVRKYPREPEWFSLLGRLGELAGDWNKAVDGYTKAAELGHYRPDLVRALFNACRRADRPKLVIDFATEKLSSRVLATMPLELASLAWAYHQTGQKQKCAETFDWALTAAGADFMAYTRIVANMISTLGMEAVLADAKARAEADPENIDRQKVLVHLYQRNNDPASALAANERVAQLAVREGDQVFAKLARGMLHELADRYQEAMPDYEAVLKINPDQPIALNNLAYLLAERLGKPAEALPYAQRAVRLNSSNPDVLDTLGWILVLNNRLGEAVGTMLRALEFNREHVSLLYHLGEAYRRRGEYEQARFRLESAKKSAEAQGDTATLPMINKSLEELAKTAP